MAASNSSVFATHAVTHRSSHTCENGATPCSSLAPGHPESSRAKAAACDSIYQSDSDLSCVGGWTDKALYQNTVSLPVEGSDDTQPGCMRHRSVHEACLDSTDHTRVVELLSSSETTSLTSTLLERGESDCALPVCTCKGGLELDDDADDTTVVIKKGTKESKDVSSAAE